MLKDNKLKDSMEIKTWKCILRRFQNYSTLSSPTHKSKQILPNLMGNLIGKWLLLSVEQCSEKIQIMRRPFKKFTYFIITDKHCKWI